MLEHTISTTLFPCENLLVLTGILPANQFFQGGEGLTFFLIGLFSFIVETHVSLQGNLSVLEAGASSTLIHCVD
jgi:hypothetical protein